jgi:hypothetical protein
MFYQVLTPDRGGCGSEAVRGWTGERSGSLKAARRRPGTHYQPDSDQRSELARPGMSGL